MTSPRGRVLGSAQHPLSPATAVLKSLEEQRRAHRTPPTPSRTQSRTPCYYNRRGECTRGDACQFLHQPCDKGGRCPDKSCRLGHPVEWRCPGCERCTNGVTGAGVLLLTDTHEEHRSFSSFDLVLVQEGRDYGDMGGRVDRNELNMAEVAARELLEETAGTVRVDAKLVAQAPWVECGLYHRYRCYVLAVDSVSCRAYDTARRRPGLPHCWRETTAMHRFPLEAVRREFIERGGNLGDTIVSHSGRHYPLAGRCRSVLIDCLKAGHLDPYLLPWRGSDGDDDDAARGAGRAEAKSTV